MNTRTISEEHKNKKYKQGFGYINNYKLASDRYEQIASNKDNFKYRIIKTTESKFINATCPDGKYDRKNDISSYEREIKDLFQRTLTPLAKTKSSKDFFAKGNLPHRANIDVAEKSNWLLEIAKTFGLVDTNRKIYWDGNSHIGYDTDEVPPMPMMQQLTDKNTINEPIKDKYKTEEEYQEALREYNNHKAEIDEKNRKIHQNLLDRDWVSVIKDFIHQAGHYNAIQDNKYQLYFGQLLLNDIKIYETRSDNHDKFRKKGVLNNENEPIYKTSSDKRLQDQYNNWLHRLIYNHYKQSQGVGEKIGNILQGFTSSSYMTLNLRAGIANILVGDTNIIGEAFAKEYFGFKDWGIAKRLWGQSLIDYMYHAYDDKSDTKVGAIIKGMNIVDYSELNGRITQVDLKKWSQIVTDLGFSFNNAGEHLMQNSAMLAMMLSHKVISNPNYGKPGEKEYIVGNFQEYTQNVREQILREVATQEQIEAYDKFIANIKKDPNGAKNYAWFKDEQMSFSKQNQIVQDPLK